jgi:hypothetical protein
MNAGPDDPRACQRLATVAINDGKCVGISGRRGADETSSIFMALQRGGLVGGPAVSLLPLFPGGRGLSGHVALVGDASVEIVALRLGNSFSVAGQLIRMSFEHESATLLGNFGSNSRSGTCPRQERGT